MLSAFGISNGLAPKQGPKALRLEVDFSSSAEFEFDLSKEQETSQLEIIQAMWVDARTFPTQIDVEIQGLPFNISIPATSQGMYPVLCGGTFRARFTTTAPSVEVPVFIFMNVPQPYFRLLP